MTATPWKGKIVLDTIAQYETLVSTGTLVIGGQTITYEPNSYDYYVKEEMITANPAGTATETLTKLKVGSTIYDIPSGITRLTN